MADIPIPTYHRAGDTLSVAAFSVPDYPASAGWALGLRLINATAKYDVGGAASGADYSLSAAANITASWAPGAYTWVATVTKGAERYTVGNGQIVIAPDLAAQAAGYDTRGVAQKAYEQTQAALAAWSPDKAQVAEYDIAGRRMKFRSALEIEQLLQFWRKQAAEEKAAERLAQGLSGGKTIRVRF